VNARPDARADARVDAGLLLLRGAGLLLAVTFGRQKLIGYIELVRAGQPLGSSGLAPLIQSMGIPFPGFLGVCAVLNESLGASLIAVGLLTRWAAAIAAFGMTVAFYVSVRLGEDVLRAALYLIIFTALAVAGPGRFSIDGLLAARGERNRAQ
jgi:putative oxidoreductase